MYTFPQTPTSAFGFIDHASTQELEKMIASKNPYSAVALSRLQAIRDAKMKADAQREDTPPLSQTIPQQLQSMEGQSGIQQLPQGMPQGMPHGAAQGIASIGGAPTGAGGGMVSFNNGGNVRHFFTGTTSGNEISTPTDFDAIEAANLAIKNFPPPPGLEIRKAATNIGKPDPLIQYRKDLAAAKSARDSIPINENISAARFGEVRVAPNSTPTSSSVNLTPAQQAFVASQGGQQFQAKNAGAPVSAAAPAAAANPSDAGLGSLSTQSANIAKDQVKAMEIPYANQSAALQNTLDVMRTAQEERDAAYNPEKFAEAQGTQEERDKLQADRLAKLEQTMPDPYKKTADRLTALGDELGKDKASAPNQALLVTAFKLMSNKSPYFMTALGDAGAAGVAEYNQIKDANKKQEMALMSAETSLAAAQDARKRGMNSDASAYMKDFYDRKRDAFNFGVSAAEAKAAGAIQLAGEEQKIPQLKIDQIKNTYAISNDLFKRNLQIQEMGLKAQELGQHAIPDAAKVAIYLSKNPGMAPFLEREENKSLFGKMYQVGKKDQDKTGKNDDELISDAIKAVSASNKAYPAPMIYGK